MLAGKKMKVSATIVVILAQFMHVCGSYLKEPEQQDDNVESYASSSSGQGNNNNIHSNTEVRRVVPIMFSRSISATNDNIIECSESIDEFPQFFTDEQRKHGAVAIAFIVAIYCFTTIAMICDNYFLPCVERICISLNLTKDVAAATFMSVATSSPELFVNIIGTFITNSDIGIGTVVGSSMFNTLGVASIGGLAATSPIQLDWWPLTRDTIIYIMAILLLVSITWDGVVHWYEALLLFIVYFVYFTVMFQNVRIASFIRKCAKPKSKIEEEPVKSPELTRVSCIDGPIQKFTEHKDEPIKCIENVQADGDSLFKFPDGHWLKKAFFIYAWPIRLVLFLTIPDCKKHKKFFPATFIMCVIWIGTNSYIVSWMITIIGYTFGIQDSILGLTFLAAGACLPEAISIAITSRRGEGAMGVSNALGANTMNILLSLGFPWFIKTTITQKQSSIKIVSGSIEYTILALVVVAVTLYLTLTCNKFRLSRINGLILVVFYCSFLVLAILSELVFFKRVDCQELKS